MLFVCDENYRKKLLNLIFLEYMGEGILLTGQGDGFRVINEKRRLFVNVELADALEVFVRF